MHNSCAGVRARLRRGRLVGCEQRVGDCRRFGGRVNGIGVLSLLPMGEIAETDVERGVRCLAKALALGELLAELAACHGDYDLLHHWQQGEFHHDVVVRVRHAQHRLTYVVATNCNGGVKEVLAFAVPPTAAALWHWRCPDSNEFAGTLPTLYARATTPHYFDPCELLAADARSELLPEHRERQPGGGWRAKRKCGT
jgi:hypothetical protein